MSEFRRRLIFHSAVNVLPNGYRRVSAIYSTNVTALRLKNFGSGFEVDMQVRNISQTSNTEIIAGYSQAATAWFGYKNKQLSVGGIDDIDVDTSNILSVQVRFNTGEITLRCNDVEISRKANDVKSQVFNLFSHEEMYSSRCAIYSFKVRKEQVLFEGIPCVNELGDVGMYDTIGGIFYTTKYLAYIE